MKMSVQQAEEYVSRSLAMGAMQPNRLIRTIQLACQLGQHYGMTIDEILEVLAP